jgi:hypothetical protein
MKKGVPKNYQQSANVYENKGRNFDSWVFLQMLQKTQAVIRFCVDVYENK